jgi:tRNA(Arg) A34 adenosine deaminase TadA
MRISKRLLEEAIAVSQEEARRGVRLGHGGPFGAAIVKGGKIIAAAHNTVLRDSDPSCHAEVNAIRKATKMLGAPHLKGCVLVASSEPCPMCLTTSYWAGLSDIRYCLPRSVAARVGFDDAFIYDDLARRASARRVSVAHERVLMKEGEAVFAEWQKRNGALY